MWQTVLKAIKITKAPTQSYVTITSSARFSSHFGFNNQQIKKNWERWTGGMKTHVRYVGSKNLSGFWSLFPLLLLSFSISEYCLSWGYENICYSRHRVMSSKMGFMQSFVFQFIWSYKHISQERTGGLMILQSGLRKIAGISKQAANYNGCARLKNFFHISLSTTGLNWLRISWVNSSGSSQKRQVPLISHYHIKYFSNEPESYK